MRRRHIARVPNGIRRGCRGDIGRQLESEGRPAADRALDADPAMMGFDHVATKGQAQSGPPLPLASGPCLVV